MQSEKATFVSALQQCMSLETGSALLATDVDTFEKLRAKRGLNVDTPEDGSILALLNKMKGYESKIDLDIDGVDADALRRLHIKMRKDSHAAPADLWALGRIGLNRSSRRGLQCTGRSPKVSKQGIRAGSNIAAIRSVHSCQFMRVRMRISLSSAFRSCSMKMARVPLRTAN